ncbi:ribonucleoside hydrolase RihC [Oenococcus oeni]|uniref:ribonucleoside hydrolase RihC n=1 Tax=Oenococcus oeni TaxID=1247 RepID=UPI000BDF39B6|nr:ribonucleoside hydrolase RihC [Oenococcus oeni]PDH74793.1 nucleoside hydrolase [Oenococcus oeni]PDH90506.1 nucleoside hydrolase [Oenococcus oeni]PDH91957.1 nucleoside hydrolase [Oenococcus oeni]PDH93289.1 nucleoside hydrolase [Oenococcus oeni]PDH94559.1 nucleoside hydrolase [Oenococcus oeni]
MKVIIDMDPGIDDAVALSVLLNNKNCQVELITTVAGNVTVDKTTKNALKIANFFNSEVPLAAGASQPLVKAFEDAARIHGESGMEGYDFPEGNSHLLKQPAVEAWHDVLNKTEKKITLILTGSYTNFALWYREYPEDVLKIERVIVMGGSLSGGNMTSAAEFNVFTDPEAAKILLSSNLSVTMIGLDVTLKALVDRDWIQKVAALNESGKMLAALISHYNDWHADGWPIHDVNTVAYLLHPEFYSSKKLWVDIATDGPAIGETVADIRAAYHQGRTNATVVTDIDADAFRNWLKQEISSMTR